MAEYVWTQNAEFKMKYYGLSRQKVSGIIRRPDRVERGIAGNGTIAVMQAVSPKMIDGKKVWKQEIWTMYQQQKTRNEDRKTGSGEQGEGMATPKNILIEQLRHSIGDGRKIKIISAWRYPGVSPKNNPIPAEILREIEEGNFD